MLMRIKASKTAIGLIQLHPRNKLWKKERKKVIEI